MSNLSNGLIIVDTHVHVGNETLNQVSLDLLREAFIFYCSKNNAAFSHAFQARYLNGDNYSVMGVEMEVQHFGNNIHIIVNTHRPNLLFPFLDESEMEGFFALNDLNDALRKYGVPMAFAKDAYYRSPLKLLKGFHKAFFNTAELGKADLRFALEEFKRAHDVIVPDASTVMSTMKALDPFCSFSFAHPFLQYTPVSGKSFNVPPVKVFEQLDELKFDGVEISNPYTDPDCNGQLVRHVLTNKLETKLAFGSDWKFGKANRRTVSSSGRFIGFDVSLYQFSFDTLYISKFFREDGTKVLS